MLVIKEVHHSPKLPNIIKHVGIYVRVSTQRKEQLNSIASQISGIIHDLAYHNTWELYYIYLDVQSGRDVEDRHGYLRMLEDARNGK